ncbi:hypothetical protein SPRG_20306 [Saprolegnia parasitica CBS 223.65]|uniref:Enoyl reductase (ER) domain-containing protein n=1 Tax=Saprolegnia parasitica (strain CBS 223.65) TaxID=695850 RepID=A0A067CAS1_SAPPC|nr:hypothetical protein SPRG_20306 [Saprolegnia parasitica CBS 223.65]KDO27593.1 hypothetical protein SPRG_20306 [Saprolegnia parasitica CBS 223.65]|eukprot:XP_012201782.1 hypothetical protein SPRG_20306 [Saprolegnia parasitica CBS 223.65]
MRAVLYSFFTSNGRWFNPEAKKPTVGTKDSVVVQVKAAGINPVDYKLPALFMQGKGVGLDVAGVVTAVSPDVTTLSVGDHVFGSTNGSLAEHALCQASKLTLLPASLSFVEGAALPTTYITGYQALVNHGFKAGQSLLILGASGGCGTAAIQLAKGLGAREIVGVCSKANEELVLSLGADRIIDYKTQSITDPDGGGEDYLVDSQTVLNEKGTYVAINGKISLWLRHFLGMGQFRPNVHLLLADPKSVDFKAVADILEAQKVKPIIDSVFPFTPEGVEDAFAKLHSRRAKGKIVVNVSAE